MEGNLNFHEGTILCSAGKRNIYVTEKPQEDGFNTFKPKGEVKLEHAINKIYATNVIIFFHEVKLTSVKIKNGVRIVKHQ